MAKSFVFWRTSASTEPNCQICTCCLTQLMCSLQVNQKENNMHFFMVGVCLSTGLTSSEILLLTSYSVLPLNTRGWISTRLVDQCTATALSSFSCAMFYTFITSYPFICLNCRLCRTDMPELHSSVHDSLKLRLLSAFVMQNSF